MWVSARDIGFTIAIAATVVLAGCAVSEMDKREAEWLASQETVQQTVVQAVEPTPEAKLSIAEPETEEIKTVMLWDVPLDAELQLFIVQLCEEHHIDPAVVIAMIEKESSYRASVIGDGGDSFGLMQVQPKWHQDRMNKHGATDLLNPFQNVTIGIDYLAEMVSKGHGLKWALAAYNEGPKMASLGLGFDYADDVLAIKENLKERTVEYAIHG